MAIADGHRFVLPQRPSRLICLDLLTGQGADDNSALVGSVGNTH
jgi:hypothetical protein